jgi:hypothetical protein
MSPADRREATNKDDGMTPEETKQYIEGRLRESGWTAHIGKASYDKIYRFTDGTEAGAKQFCYKLLSLSSLLPDREITDDLVEMALDDLASVDELLRRPARAAGQGGVETVDRESIEQLAATLEAKVTSGDVPVDAWSDQPMLPKAGSALTVDLEPAIAARASAATRTKPRIPRQQKIGESKRPRASVGDASAADTTAFTITRADRLVPDSRPMMAPRAATPLATGSSLVERLYRLSSTTTITFTATVLVVVTLVLILYANPSAVDSGRTVRNVPAAHAESKSPTMDATAPAVPVAPSSEQSARTTVGPSDAAPQKGAAAVPKREPAGAAGATPTQPETNAQTANGLAASTAPVSATRNNAPPSTRSTPASSNPPPAASNRAGGSPTSTATDTGQQPQVTAQRSGATPPSATPAPPPAAAVTPTVSANASAPKVEAGRVSPLVSAPTTAVAAAPKQEPPATPVISRDELASLLRRFVYVYESGDVNQFVSLFAESARTNDQSSRQGIREDYERFFRSTDLRQMKLGQVNWDVSDGRAEGSGNFDVIVRRAGEQESEAYTGSLSFQVEKVDGRLRITRLYHGQRRTEP